MLARHVRSETQIVVLASGETGAASLISVRGNRNLRQDLERDLCRGLRALGLIAFDRQGLVQRYFYFPWLQDDPDGQAMFEEIYRGLHSAVGSGDPEVWPSSTRIHRSETRNP